MKRSEFLEVCGVKEFFENWTEEEALEAVKRSGSNLQFVRYKTPEICMEAVKEDGLALKYVNNQTLKICLEAVKRNHYAINYVNDSIFEPEDDMKNIFGDLFKKYPELKEISIRLANK